MNEQRGRSPDPVTQALHDLRHREAGTPAQEIQRYQEAAQEVPTHKKLIREFGSIPYVYKPGTEEVDYAATWYGLKERRLALEALFSPEIVSILLQQLQSGETGLYRSRDRSSKLVILEDEITPDQLDKIGDSAIARELAILTQKVWLWSLQIWESRFGNMLNEGLFEKPSLYKTGFYGLSKIAQFYNDQVDAQDVARDPNVDEDERTDTLFSQYISPWELFENGATHGNREIWRFLDLISKMNPDKSVAEVTDIARNSYSTLAYLATFHETFSEPLASFLSSQLGAWDLDPHKFELTDRGGKLRVVVKHQTWTAFLQRFRSPEEPQADTSGDQVSPTYILPNYQAEGKGATLGCPLFQAPSMKELHDAARGETGARSIATPVAVFEQYLQLAERYIYRRRHPSA